MELKPLGDFIFLLCEEDESKNILQKRFKKDLDSLATLYMIIEKIDDLGYDKGIDFAFNLHYMDTVRTDKNLSLVEIRIRDNFWRAITYNSVDCKQLVVLDAFEHHKHIQMKDMVKRVEHMVHVVRELLGEAM